jgi:presenilin-like A22 family membrane protease
MKHSVKMTVLLLSMFFVAQLIGIYVSHVYRPITAEEFNNLTGMYENKTSYALPSVVTPPQQIDPWDSVKAIVGALIFAVLLMLMLMKLRAEVFLRIWFFAVVIIGLTLALNAVFIQLTYAIPLAVILALPLAYFKVFKRNLVVHNITELLIYPGIAAVFIPILNLKAILVLLVIISAYDIYAVWHAGFMQKMAKYQIEKVRVFSGFFIPYMLPKSGSVAKKSTRKGRAHVAILGGGDVVFPIILAGVVMQSFGILGALMVAVGATVALGLLFYYSEKGKFYPAMPFISAGCFVALGLAYLIA